MCHIILDRYWNNYERKKEKSMYTVHLFFYNMRFSWCQLFGSKRGRVETKGSQKFSQWLVRKEQSKSLFFIVNGLERNGVVLTKYSDQGHLDGVVNNSSGVYTRYTMSVYSFSRFLKYLCNTYWTKFLISPFANLGNSLPVRVYVTSVKSCY